MEDLLACGERCEAGRPTKMLMKACTRVAFVGKKKGTYTRDVLKTCHRIYGTFFLDQNTLEGEATEPGNEL